MESITIVYKIKFLEHNHVRFDYQGTEQRVEIDLDDMETQDLPSQLIEFGYLKAWSLHHYGKDYKILDRYIKQ